MDWQEEMQKQSVKRLGKRCIRLHYTTLSLTAYEDSQSYCFDFIHPSYDTPKLSCACAMLRLQNFWKVMTDIFYRVYRVRLMTVTVILVDKTENCSV